MKFRKKPVVIEAREFADLTIAAQEELADWCGGRLLGYLIPAEDRVIEIDTLEGKMTARPGDWIIRGVKGEFYPCKPEIFEATYDPVDGRPYDADAAIGDPFVCLEYLEAWRDGDWPACLEIDQRVDETGRA